MKLEIAMGLETVDPEVLPRIKSSMTLDDFESAARFLTDNGIDIRAFILLGPPGHLGGERIDWAQRSIDYAFSVGVECCVVIPVRPGNGIVEALEAKSLYSRANLAELQSVVEYGIAQGAVAYSRIYGTSRTSPGALAAARRGPRPSRR